MPLRLRKHVVSEFRCGERVHDCHGGTSAMVATSLLWRFSFA